MARRFGKANARERDTLVTVRKPASTGRDAYENGRIRTTGFTTIEFFGKVTDMMDAGGDVRYAEYKRLDARSIVIEADSESVRDVNISDTLTLDTSNDTFEVMDKWESSFRYTAKIIGKYKR